MKKRKRKVPWSVGDILAISLGEQRSSFAWVLESPLIAFFDNACDDDRSPPIVDIVSKPIAFRIWVMKYAVTDGVWPVIGRVDVPPQVREPPWFCKQDSITKRLSMTRTGAEEIPCDLAQCATLEKAAVWDPQHVVDRLRDHYAGRPNKWVEALKPRK